MPLPHAPSVVVDPPRAIPGARIDLRLSDPVVDVARLPDVRVGDRPARVVFASPGRVGVLVPDEASGPERVAIAGVEARATAEIGRAVATGLHQVDSPAIDGEGNLYVTYSGKRGERVPVSVFRVGLDGVRAPFVSGLVNATSLAFDGNGVLYISSRFDGNVYRVGADGHARLLASELGVACGLAFAPDGTLYVGDRTGTVLRVDRAGKAVPFATLPPSVAAFHLAFGPDGALYVAAPSLRTSDDVYRIDANGTVTVAASGFGRPQGLAFDASGRLHVAEALAGSGGLFRLDRAGHAERVVAAPSLIGVAFGPDGTMVVATADTVYRWTAA